MIKREFKVNFKSFIIWTSILIIMFLIVFLLYPYIINDDAMKNIDEMLKIYPKEVLKAFNMDLSSINTAYGWLKTEGFVFVLLIIGFYSSNLGMNILLKEENDKTIEYLISLPIKRNNIITNKLIVSIIYITLMILLLGIFNYIALNISGNFNHKEYILLSITPLLIAFPLYSISLFISTLFNKTKNNTGISLGIVFISYIINILSELSSKVEFIKYFSIYTLADTRNVISKVKINPTYIGISLAITIFFISLSYIKYNKKELI